MQKLKTELAHIVGTCPNDGHTCFQDDLQGMKVAEADNATIDKLVEFITENFKAKS